MVWSTRTIRAEWRWMQLQCTELSSVRVYIWPGCFSWALHCGECPGCRCLNSISMATWAVSDLPLPITPCSSRQALSWSQECWLGSWLGCSEPRVQGQLQGGIWFLSKLLWQHPCSLSALPLWPPMIQGCKHCTGCRGVLQTTMRLWAPQISTSSLSYCCFQPAAPGRSPTLCAHHS